VGGMSVRKTAAKFEVNPSTVQRIARPFGGASLNAFVGNPMGAVGAPWVVDGIAVNSPSVAGTSIAQLLEAMAGFGGGSGAADSLSAVPLGADTSQQAPPTMSQHA
jgi:hypothetical protein